MEQRGGKSHYSLAFISRDRSFILNNWVFLVEQLQKLICILQVRCEEVCKAEASRQGRQGRHQLALRTAPLNKTRSLTELTNDGYIFHRLHVWYVWLLRAAARRCREELVVAPAPEDEQLARELAEEVTEALELEEDDVGTLVPNTPRKEHLEIDVDTGDTVDGSVSCEFRNPRHAYRVLGDSNFVILLRHVLVGDQLVVQTEFRSLATSLFQCLGKLLPLGCLLIVEDSDQYMESFRANLLHVRPGVELPSCSPGPTQPPLLLHVTCTSQEPFLTPEKLHYRLSLLQHASSPSGSSPPPQLLREYLRILVESTLGDAAMELALAACKEKWLNRAKLLHGLRRSRRGTDVSVVNQLLSGPLGCADNVDQQLVKFWTRGLSDAHKQRLGARLQAAETG